jgi:hypothetical protein
MARIDDNAAAAFYEKGWKAGYSDGWRDGMRNGGGSMTICRVGRSTTQRA